MWADATIPRRWRAGCQLSARFSAKFSVSRWLGLGTGQNKTTSAVDLFVLIGKFIVAGKAVRWLHTTTATAKSPLACDRYREVKKRCRVCRGLLNSYRPSWRAAKTNDTACVVLYSRATASHSINAAYILMEINAYDRDI